MSEKLTYPPDGYCQLFLNLFEDINGPEYTEPMIKQNGRNYDSRIWCSRGEVLEKAGIAMIQINHQDAEGHRFIRHFDTVIHPNNPRVPGFVVVIGQEKIEVTGQRRIYCLVDLWRMTRRPNVRAIDQFRVAIETVCQNQERSYAQLQRSLPSLGLFGGNGCNAGLFYGEFGEMDIPLIDQIVEAVVRQIPLTVTSCRTVLPNVQDFQERNEIRREFLVWAFNLNRENKRAVAAGVPWSVFEAFAFPPEVQY